MSDASLTAALNGGGGGVARSGTAGTNVATVQRCADARNASKAPHLSLCVAGV